MLLERLHKVASCHSSVKYCEHFENYIRTGIFTEYFKNETIINFNYDHKSKQIYFFKDNSIIINLASVVIHKSRNKNYIVLTRDDNSDKTKLKNLGDHLDKILNIMWTFKDAWLGMEESNYYWENTKVGNTLSLGANPVHSEIKRKIVNFKPERRLVVSRLLKLIESMEICLNEADPKMNDFVVVEQFRLKRKTQINKIKLNLIKKQQNQSKFLNFFKSELSTKCTFVEFKDFCEQIQQLPQGAMLKKYDEKTLETEEMKLIKETELLEALRKNRERIKNKFSCSKCEKRIDLTIHESSSK